MAVFVGTTLNESDFAKKEIMLSVRPFMNSSWLSLRPEDLTSVTSKKNQLVSFFISLLNDH